MPLSSSDVLRAASSLRHDGVRQARGKLRRRPCPSSLSLRVSVLRPQPSSFAASCRPPRVTLSASRSSVRSNSGIASSSSGVPPLREARLRPARERHRPLGAVGRRRRTGAAEIGRNVARLDLAPGGQHREATTRVDELPYVAGPVEGRKCARRIVGQHFRRDAELDRGRRRGSAAAARGCPRGGRAGAGCGCG